MFEKLPAAKTPNWTFLLFFSICFSSGSTKAAGIGPKNANPELLIFMLNNLATTPWENSWIIAIIIKLIIQCKKLNVGKPGAILIPGNTGANAGGASGTNNNSNVALTNMAVIAIIPTKPTNTPRKVNNFKNLGCFLATLSIQLNPHLVLYKAKTPLCISNLFLCLK